MIWFVVVGMTMILMTERTWFFYVWYQHRRFFDPEVVSRRSRRRTSFWIDVFDQRRMQNDWLSTRQTPLRSWAKISLNVPRFANLFCVFPFSTPWQIPEKSSELRATSKWLPYSDQNADSHPRICGGINLERHAMATQWLEHFWSIVGSLSSRNR